MSKDNRVELAVYALGKTIPTESIILFHNYHAKDKYDDKKGAATFAIKV